MVIQKLKGRTMLNPGFEKAFSDIYETHIAYNSFEKQIDTYYNAYQRCFKKIRHKDLSLEYLSFLLSKQKNNKTLQRFMRNYDWDHRDVSKAYLHFLSNYVSNENGMINIDCCYITKSENNKKTAGVSWQKNEYTGRSKNYQSGIFISYASPNGYGILDSRLFIPGNWFSNEYKELWKENLIPEDLQLKTKKEIASELINSVSKEDFPNKWIGCGETFNNIDFLQQFPGFYFASVNPKTKVYLKRPQIGIPKYKGKGPRPRKIQVLPGEPILFSLEQLIELKFVKLKTFELRSNSVSIESDLPVIADIGRERVYPSQKSGLPRESVWLFVKKQGDQTKYYLSNAPEEISFYDLSKAAAMRHRIENFFMNESKQVGLERYKHRSWPAWHRHMLHVAMAQNFLFIQKLRKELRENTYFIQ